MTKRQLLNQQSSASTSATVTTSTSLELASSHVSVTSIKSTSSQWVSESVCDKDSQRSDTGPIKMSSVPPSMQWSFASLVKTGRDARKGPFFPLLQAIEGGGGRGGGELPTACSCCGQYGHRSRSGERTGRVIGDESEGGRGLAGFKQAAHHLSNQVDKISMFHVPASDQGGLWGESGLHLVSSHRPLLLTFSRLCPLPSHEPSRKQPGTFFAAQFCHFLAIRGFDWTSMDYTMYTLPWKVDLWHFQGYPMLVGNPHRRPAYFSVIHLFSIRHIICWKRENLWWENRDWQLKS